MSERLGLVQDLALVHCHIYVRITANRFGSQLRKVFIAVNARLSRSSLF